MSEEAVMEFSAATKEMGDKIAGLTLKEARELSEYLKEEHKIEAAAGGAVVMGGGGGGFFQRQPGCRPGCLPPGDTAR